MRGIRRRSAAWLAAAALAVSWLPLISTSSGAEAATVAAPYVSGTTLYHGTGLRYVLTGASVHFVEQYADAAMQKTTLANWNNRDAILRKMRSMGMNTIRIPLTHAAYDASQIRSQTAWLDRLQAIVDTADAYDMNVIFSWWDGDSAGANWPNTYDKLFPMLRAVVGRLGNNPRVMYEPWNEPNNVSWAQWRTAMQATIDELRGPRVGYTGVIIVDTINWSWSFDPAEVQPISSQNSNILFSNHRYANLSTCFCGTELTNWQNEVGKQASAFPIAVLETGYYNNPYGPTPAWNQQFLQYLTSPSATSYGSVPNGLNGVMAFVWDWVDANTMVTPDGERTNLTQWGAIYRDAYLAGVATYGDPGSPRASLMGSDVADADVNSNKTKANDGSGTLLWVDARRDSYVKFAVSGVNGRHVVRAAIRFYVSSGTNRSTAKFHRVPNTTWLENTITWANAPAPDPAVLDAVTSLVYAQSYTIDVTQVITGDGTYSFKFDSGSSDSAAFASKETANPPVLYLVVE
jgi:hypothetical protein